MQVGGNFIQQGGFLKFDSCMAWQDGGGLHVNGWFSQEGGSALFQACEANQSGGGLNVLDNISIAGSSTFQSCAAGEGPIRDCLVRHAYMKLFSLTLDRSISLVVPQSTTLTVSADGNTVRLKL